MGGEKPARAEVLIRDLPSEEKMRLRAINGYSIFQLERRMRPYEGAHLLKTEKAKEAFFVEVPEDLREVYKRRDGCPFLTDFQATTGMIGYYGDLRYILAVQHEFVRMYDLRHEQIAECVRSLFDQVEKLGLFEMGYRGNWHTVDIEVASGQSRRLEIKPKKWKGAMPCPFGTKEGSTREIVVYDPELDVEISISEIHESFARDIGFYEHSESPCRHSYAILPDILVIFRFVEDSIDSVRTKYNEVWLEYNRLRIREIRDRAAIFNYLLERLDVITEDDIMPATVYPRGLSQIRRGPFITIPSRRVEFLDRFSSLEDLIVYLRERVEFFEGRRDEVRHLPAKEKLKIALQEMVEIFFAFGGEVVFQPGRRLERWKEKIAIAREILTKLEIFFRDREDFDFRNELHRFCYEQWDLLPYEERKDKRNSFSYMTPPQEKYL